MFPIRSREYYLQHRYAWHSDVERFSRHINTLLGDRTFHQIQQEVDPHRLEQLLDFAYALEDVAASSQKGDELFSFGTGVTKTDYDTTEYKGRIRRAKLQIGRTLANLKGKNTSEYLNDTTYDAPDIQKPHLLYPKKN